MTNFYEGLGVWSDLAGVATSLAVIGGVYLMTILTVRILRWGWTKPTEKKEEEN